MKEKKYRIRKALYGSTPERITYYKLKAKSELYLRVSIIFVIGCLLILLLPADNKLIYLTGLVAIVFGAFGIYGAYWIAKLNHESKDVQTIDIELSDYDGPQIFNITLGEDKDD